eukprot:2663481-Amphidinium_carterae.2
MALGRHVAHSVTDDARPICWLCKRLGAHRTHLDFILSVSVSRAQPLSSNVAEAVEALRLE